MYRWLVTTLCVLMIFCAGAKLDREAYLLATRTVFVQSVYLTTYGKRLPCLRAQAIVGWCQDAASLHGLKTNWLLALAARERSFLNTDQHREGDGFGYMQVTIERARMLDPKLGESPDEAVGEYLVLNPASNIMLAAKFLAELKRSSKSWRDAVCRFNVGPAGNVKGEAATKHWAAVERYHRALVSSQN